jgi:hypothetical protein
MKDWWLSLHVDYCVTSSIEQVTTRIGIEKDQADGSADVTPQILPSANANICCGWGAYRTLRVKRVGWSLRVCRALSQI